MTAHDMTTEGAGSNSRLNSARMHQGSTENADRLLAERRAGSPAVSHSDSLADHYAERAAQREAAHETAEAPAELSPEELAARIIAGRFHPWTR